MTQNVRIVHMHTGHEGPDCTDDHTLRAIFRLFTCLFACTAPTLRDTGHTRPLSYLQSLAFVINERCGH
jgi:hypothetical protein